jgi:hypothetical protein
MTEGGRISGNRYEQQWLEYKRRRDLFLFVFVVYGVMVGVISYLTQGWIHNHELTNVLGFSWFLLMIITVGRLQVWRCPRCGERFFMKSVWHNLFTSRCLHCGLEKYADS